MKLKGKKSSAGALIDSHRQLRDSITTNNGILAIQDGTSCKQVVQGFKHMRNCLRELNETLFKRTFVSSKAIKSIRSNKLFSSQQISNSRSFRFNAHLDCSSSFNLLPSILFIVLISLTTSALGQQPNYEPAGTSNVQPINPEPEPQASTTAATCFGGLQTFEKISMSAFESPSSASSSSFGSGILVQQDDQALTSECVNLCRSQSNCLSFVIDYNKFECKSYATTQQELQQELDSRHQAARSLNSSIGGNSSNQADSGGYQASTIHFQHLLPSTSSNYFEKICLDGVANRNQFSDVCGSGRLWTIERVVDSFLDGFVEKEVTNVNNKDECSKLCIFETQFVCRSADYDYHSRLCRLSKEDRRTQPQAMRQVSGSNRQYLENQCATPGPSSCVYETMRNVGVISMDALKFAQTVQDCQMKCNQESTFNCRSYSFHQQRCFLSGDDGSSLNSNLIKLPVKQGWQFGEKKCLVELCTKGIFTYEKITGYTLRSALSTPIDLMMPSGSSLGMTVVGNNLDELDRLQHESSQAKLRRLLPTFQQGTNNNSTPSIVSVMMMMAANSDPTKIPDPLHESDSSIRNQRSASNLAITDNCRHSCDLGYLNCPAFTIDYKNNRCQRLDRNSQGRHQELVSRDGFAYFEKICLRVPEIMSMCRDKYWIFERVIGYELAPRLYDKSLKFVQSRRDCEEYCLEEKQFQCRSALYNDETSECKLSHLDRRLAMQEGGYYRNYNVRISYLENQCVRDHGAEKNLQCFYEQAKDEPAYPTYTEHIEMVPPLKTTSEGINRQQQVANNGTTLQKVGQSYCEQLCNNSARFECYSFGYYASTAQCFLSGDDSVSAGDFATTISTGFTYFERKCLQRPNDQTFPGDSSYSGGRITPTGATTTTMSPQAQNPYFPTNSGANKLKPIADTTGDMNYQIMSPNKPSLSNNNISIHIDQQLNMGSPPKQKDPVDITNESSVDPDHYKCGNGHTFVYQRISGFEPIGGYLTLLVKDNEHPGIVSECSELCKRAYECRAFIVDYASNQCYAMLENSAVGMLSLRQTLGKDYFEGFCVANHILLAGSNCRNRTWIMDKIVDQAIIGVQHHKLIPDMDRSQCRQACLEERLFWCKSAMFDVAMGDCKLYSIDRESNPQMRLLFTKGVDFFENQCQIMSNSCPYDAIERDMKIITGIKSVQARSTFECEQACNEEMNFNCRSYTYFDQYPGLPNLCSLSSDSRSTSQKGTVKEHQRTLYAERNCYYRRPRYPGGQRVPESMYSPPPPSLGSISQSDPYQPPGLAMTTDGYSIFSPPSRISSITEIDGPTTSLSDASLISSSTCDPHQYTFERTFGYDYRLGLKERASIPPTVGIAISCQQECLRRGDRCQSFVVDYALPYQSCFLIETQVGANKKMLVKAPNSAYFEKVCLPRTGVEVEPGAVNIAQPYNSNQQETSAMDIAPSYSNEPWTPQVPNQLPYYLQQQQFVQSYPSRTCAKLWSFERFINHNFTAPSDKRYDNALSKAQCETYCLNEASFSCRAATYDYLNKICRLFSHTRRTIMSKFINLDAITGAEASVEASQGNSITGNETPRETENVSAEDANKRPGGARQLALDQSTGSKNIDYMENTCVPEPSSCQYRQLYDLLSVYIDKINHAVSLSDCQRQCDLERLFSCKSINYDPASRNCMLINEDIISLERGQQGSLLHKKNTIYSEKGNCEMISVQCNPQEMLVSINFDSPFRGKVMAKGNPEQCFLIGDGQTSLQFSVVFGPKCNSRQEGHNTFVNELVIQQHPVIMTESDKTVRVMCAFEAPDQTITLKSPSSRDNKTGIDVGTTESSRTRHDKLPFSSIVSNKAPPPSVVLRILDQSGRDASMINLGDDLILRIQMQMDGQNSALGIFARNLAARSSNGESLLLIDNEGCPVDNNVFPALEVDQKDGKSLYSTFKAFRFSSSGLVNFEVQIKFCPERCQPVDCRKGQKTRSYGRRKRDTVADNTYPIRIPILQSINRSKDNPLESLSTVMKPGKAFQYVRELLLTSQANKPSLESTSTITGQNVAEFTTEASVQDQTSEEPSTKEGSRFQSSSSEYVNEDFEGSSINKDVQDSINQHNAEQKSLVDETRKVLDPVDFQNSPVKSEGSDFASTFQKSILMHIDEKVVPSPNYVQSRGLSQRHNSAPYGQFSTSEMEMSQEPSIKNMRNPVLSATATENIDQLSNFDSADDLNHRIVNPMDVTVDESLNGKSLHPEMQVSRGIPQRINSSIKQDANKDMPLRFSILVGESQTPNNWEPNRPVLVMNSSNVDLDHIVIPGKEGQLHQPSTSDTRFSPSTQSPNYTDNNYPTSKYQNETGSRTSQYDQTFDTQPSNSVRAEVSINSVSQLDTRVIPNLQDNSSPSVISEASHNCQVESSSSRLWTIIWTGTVVIILNICLVVLSLILYFRKVHLRQNHDIIRATSDCGTHIDRGRQIWPSVLLKSKSNLGTSINTHEHFFCKLNSKPSGSLGVNGGGHEFNLNWPNLSSSSSHSTISSMVSPLPVTSTGINHNRAHESLGETSLRQQFNSRHRNFFDADSFERNTSHEVYKSNIDAQELPNNSR